MPCKLCVEGDEEQIKVLNLMCTHKGRNEKVTSSLTTGIFSLEIRGIDTARTIIPMADMVIGIGMREYIVRVLQVFVLTTKQSNGSIYGRWPNGSSYYEDRRFVRKEPPSLKRVPRGVCQNRCAVL
jgi:hypothetical protein